MAMPDTARRYTVDDVLAFPDDGNRYELVRGELLVTPAPNQTHQRVLARLHLAIGPYLAGYEGGAVAFLSPADVIWGPEDYVQPDLFVVPSNEVTGDWRDCRTLLLAVEVVSPSSARADRTSKRRLYQRQGVATYWIVDPDAELVEVWHPDDDRPAIVTDTLRWRLAPEVSEFTLDVGRLFADFPPS
jgi:Uma2 family endonuclease